MRKSRRPIKLAFVVISGLVVGLLSFMITVQIVTASGVKQDDEPPPETQEGEPVAPEHELYTAQECQECHLDVTNHWEPSPHANAFSDPAFQERWVGMGEPGECLTCHTTDYNPSTGEYDVEGISCQACHGEVAKDHPPEPVPILADTQYCGSCHTTTLSEWHLTGHSTEDIGCTDCHDPHNQAPLFEDPDDLCINCHEDTMGDYLEGTHDEQDIGCVDCHALVIPPEEEPEDGIVPTGHAFTITPATCVACHTDALHAGFSLPGYEHGAKNGPNSQNETEAGDEEPLAEGEDAEASEEAGLLSPEQQIQALEAAMASRNTTLLFQGAVVGLVLGGSTAWIVANNVRTRKEEEESEDDEE